AGARGARIARPGPVEPAVGLHAGDLAGDHQDACLPGAGQTRLRLPRAGGDPRPRGRTRLTGAGDRRASPGRGGNRDRIVAWIRASEADSARDLTHNGDNLRNGAQLVEAGVPPAPASTHVWGLFLQLGAFSSAGDFDSEGFSAATGAPAGAPVASQIL